MSIDQALDLPAWMSMPIAIAGGLLMLAFGCRVRLLTPAAHRVPVWAVHWAGMLACGWIGLSAFSGAVMHALDLAVLVMGGAHIWGTYYSWAWGVPDHAVRPGVQAGPVALPEGVLARVVGGRSSDDRGQP